MRVDTAQIIIVGLLLLCDALTVCTVGLEWCWKPPTDRSGNDLSDQSSQSAEHVVVNYTTEEPEHQPRANDHEGRNAE